MGRHLFLSITVLFLSSTPLLGDTVVADGYSGVDCVPRCVQRSIQGKCWNYGSDFCAHGPGVACIPTCNSRSLQGRCLNFGPDFCGVYPDCQPYCTRRMPSGRCLRWGRDQCRSLWP